MHRLYKCPPHSVIQGQSPQSKSKIFNSSPKWLLWRHFQKWLSPTDPTFHKVSLDLRTSNYEEKGYVELAFGRFPSWLEICLILYVWNAPKCCKFSKVRLSLGDSNSSPKFFLLRHLEKRLPSPKQSPLGSDHPGPCVSLIKLLEFSLSRITWDATGARGFHSKALIRR